MPLNVVRAGPSSHRRFFLASPIRLLYVAHVWEQFDEISGRNLSLEDPLKRLLQTKLADLLCLFRHTFFSLFFVGLLRIDMQAKFHVVQRKCLQEGTFSKTLVQLSTPCSMNMQWPKWNIFKFFFRPTAWYRGFKIWQKLPKNKKTRKICQKLQFQLKLTIYSVFRNRLLTLFCGYAHDHVCQISCYSSRTGFGTGKKKIWDLNGRHLNPIWLSHKGSWIFFFCFVFVSLLMTDYQIC